VNVKRPEWQLPRQSGFAGPDAVADANRYAKCRFFLKNVKIKGGKDKRQKQVAPPPRGERPGLIATLLDSR
jgi:hypothetical protein